jgi:hypothetical protein
MLADTRPNPRQVIVSTEDGACHPIKSVCAHHRDFPEIRGEDETSIRAAEKLVERLTSALDGAGTGWHRTYIKDAIEDVKAFVEEAP